VLKEASDENDMLPRWIDFALVARDLAEGKRLEDVLLMRVIADATLRAFVDRSERFQSH
jgi:hypothetical protein